MTNTSDAADRQVIVEVLARLQEGHVRKDAAKILACYASGALIYSLAPPLA